MPAHLRVLIADDEPIARRGIRQQLAGVPDLEICGECGNGRDAVELVKTLDPDLVFLDVQMPGLDGFGVIAQLGSARAPEIVFVTAHDQYTLRAFEVAAVDYLLKPVDPARFQTALARARARVAAGRSQERLQAALALIERRLRPLDRLAIKNDDRITFVDTKQIDWLEAADNYVRVVVGGESHLVHETLTSLEKKLDPSRFLRIHRSRLVNVERIRTLQPLFHGEFLVTLADGTQLTSGRTHREALQALVRG